MSVPFSRELDSVVREAKELAQRTSRRLGSAHLLLALFTVPNQAQQYLREHAIDERALLQRLDKLLDDPPELLDLILERAARVAEGTRTETVTSLHLLTALSGFKDSSAYGLMSQTGVDISDVRIRAMSFLLNDEVPLRFRVKPGDHPRPQPEPARPTSIERTTSTIAFHPGLTAQAERDSDRVKLPPPEPQPSSPRSPGTEPDRVRRQSPRSSGDNSGARKPRSDPHADLARRLFAARPAARASGSPTKRKPASAPKRPKRAANAPAGSAGRSVKAALSDPGETFELSKTDFPTLRRYGRNLTAEAARGKIDPVIGRDEEIAQLIDILNKRRANNPILLGDPGVGKTAVVEGLARLIASDAIPTGLEGRAIIELEAGRVFGGTALRGSLAERLVALKDEVARANGRVIVFLDEIHRWIGSAADGNPDGVEELKPSLARGAFPCIGATTAPEYRRTFEPDPAFSRRFQVVHVEEPSVEQTTMILEGLRDDYGAHHGVTFEDDALRSAARLSHRYLRERRNPDKALSVLDLSGSKARRREQSTVDGRLVAEVVAEMSGIPAEKLVMGERERFLRMEDHLMQSIVGHERNLARIAHVLRRNYAGFVSGRPIGSFLFLGPTGVGKTETVRALADFLFHSRDAVTVFDMSEFSEAHSVARLIGAPPGYVGHQGGGQLTDAVRRRAYQIILLDEVEKASPQVHNLLLQILDEGRLTDSQGRVADFSNSVVVMTSNMGASEAFSRSTGVGFARHDEADSSPLGRVIEAARNQVEPELWNRIDEPLVFEPLTRLQVERIAHLQLQRSSRQLLDEKGIAYTATAAVVDFLIDNGGHDPKLGARPLRRALERYVEGPIADLILRGDIEPPADVQVDVDTGELVFEVR